MRKLIHWYRKKNNYSKMFKIHNFYFFIFFIRLFDNHKIKEGLPTGSTFGATDLGTGFD